MSAPAPGPTPAEIAASWRPPSDEEVDRDLALFKRLVSRRFGARVKGLYLFGSRARGDHGPESDADVAVVLSDFDELDGGLHDELVILAYDVLLAGKTVVQPFPVSEAAWANPDLQHNQNLGRAMKRDGRRVS